MRTIIFIMTLLTLQGCRAQDSATTKDVVFVGETRQMYYRNGPLLLRGTCSNEILFTRETCEAEGGVRFAAVATKLSETYAAILPPLEAKQSQLAQVILRYDDQLLEAATAAPMDDNFQSDVESLEDTRIAIEEVDITITELKRQISVIESRPPDSSGFSAQLIDLHGELAEYKEKKLRLVTQLQQDRKNVIDRYSERWANSEYATNIEIQRSEKEQLYVSIDSQLLDALKDQIATSLILKSLGEEGSYFELDESSQAFAREKKIFTRLVTFFENALSENGDEEFRMRQTIDAERYREGEICMTDCGRSCEPVDESLPACEADFRVVDVGELEESGEFTVSIEITGEERLLAPGATHLLWGPKFPMKLKCSYRGVCQGGFSAETVVGELCVEGYYTTSIEIGRGQELSFSMNTNEKLDYVSRNNAGQCDGYVFSREPVDGSEVFDPPFLTVRTNGSSGNVFQRRQKCRSRCR